MIVDLDRRRRGSAAQRGYDRQWRKVRDAFLARHPLCECGQGASIVDHVVPINQGGRRLDESNLRSVCTACHAAMTGNLRRTGQNERPVA